MKQKKTSLEHTVKSQKTYWLIFIGIILVGSNLRAPITGVGSLIPFIREDLDITHTTAGLITTLPLLAFALVSPFAPIIARRIGMERTIFLSLFVLLAGIIVRSLYGVSFLFIGTMLIGLAIAIGNVLIPVVIQLNFPLRVGLVMGFYVVFMNIFGALSSGLSVPISSFKGIGWQGALAVWAILVFIAALLWIPQLKKQIEQAKPAKNETRKKESMWRSKLAWYITIFMGLQSLMFYTLLTWLPDILNLHGYSPSAAGWMLFLMQFVLIPITFIIPIIAERMENQKLLGGTIGALFMIGITGILSGYSFFIPIAVIMIGIACGSAFSLCMMLFSLRTQNGEQAAQLSGMAQSFGYLLAAIGPTLFGALHDFTYSWQFPLIMLIALAGVIVVTAVASGGDRKIEVGG